MASEETQSAPLKVTVKGGAAYEDPWLTVEAQDEKELAEHLSAVLDGDTLALIADLSVAFQGVVVEKVKDSKPKKESKPARRSRNEDDEEDEEQEERPSRRQSSSRSSRGGSRTSSRSGGGSSRRSSRTDDYDQGEEHPDELECDKCGSILVYKSGVSGAGNDYALWTCPKQKRKGDGHDAEFIG